MQEKTFEQALGELEKIVERMEEADLPLDESLLLFEEGIRLSRLCSDKLDEAEKKVQILLKDENGSLVKKTFDEDGAD